MYKASVERLYSKRQIKQAGKLLGNIVQKNPETIEAFQVLHNWRFHHAYPMLRERAKLTRIVKPLGGITAGRLKRTSSIRKKLFRGTTKLEQMQDLVGCRAIVNSMDDICSILERYKLANDGGGGVSKSCWFALCSYVPVRYAEASEARGDPPCPASIRPNSAACLPA
ncbi:MAG: hypothetical protein JJ869_21810 [Marivita sp.]|nr:hypothetical protein [Marivita sp.]